MMDLLFWVCPVCKTELKRQESLGAYVCQQCGENFNAEGGRPNFIPQAYRQLSAYKKWQAIQATYVRRNEETRDEDSSRHRLYFRYHDEFINEFCQMKGKVLDIGCGPLLQHVGMFRKEILPNIDYYGIDPELSVLSQNPHCVSGVGEMLPFRDQYFDCIMMISVLDHVISPELVLSEVRRVLKPNGSYYVSCPMRSLDFKSRIKKWFLYRRSANRHVTEFDKKKAYDVSGPRRF